MMNYMDLFVENKQNKYVAHSRIVGGRSGMTNKWMLDSIKEWERMEIWFWLKIAKLSDNT